MTATCSYWGYRRRSVSQYSSRTDYVRLIRGAELQLDFVSCGTADIDRLLEGLAAWVG